MLTGENGILTKAQSAKEKTLEAQELEQIQLAYLAATTNTTGEVDKEVLYEELKKITPEVSGLPESKEVAKTKEWPWEITGTTGQNYEIATEGVEKYITAEDIAKNPKYYYGKEVDNYLTEIKSAKYRIFYVDTTGKFGDANTIYLKADYYTSEWCDLSNYKSYDSEHTKVRAMNPEWAKERGDSEKDNEGNVAWNENEQAAAYLCSPVFANTEGIVQNSSLPWALYYNEEYANYVIGGPSVEMYIESYNQTHNGQNGKKALKSIYKDLNCPGYIYEVNENPSTQSWNTPDYTLDVSTTYNNMYCGRNGEISQEHWWIASPNAEKTDLMCHVFGKFARLASGGLNNKMPISPIVSLKSDFQIKLVQE